MRRRIRLAVATWLLLAGIGIGSASFAQALDPLAATVDGRRVHMLAAGRGSPAVVLEAGFGGTSLMWGEIQRELAQTNRVIAYDRAGLGESEPSARPRTSRAIAEELRQALRSVDVLPPYILVGHSAGGIHARVFAGMYPTEVAGLVLVDPAPEAFYARAKREWPLVFAHFDALDAAEQSTASAGERAEGAQWERALGEARESDGRYPGPVILLSSPRTDLRELGPIWADEQRRWVARGKRRQYVRLDGAGHAIHRHRPEAVFDAVRRVQRTP